MRTVPALASTVAVLALLAGCGADTVPQSKLSQLVLTGRDLPPGFARFDYGAQQQLDASGLRRDPTRWGRKGGWKARFHRAGGPRTDGPLVVESRADLFADAGGAKKDLLAYRETFRDAPNARTVDVPELGDGSTGMTQLQPGGRPVRSYTIAWRDRNVTGSVTVNGFAEHLRLADALALARAQERRIANR